MRDWFHAFASRMSQAAGSPLAFFCAVIVIVAWAAAGPVFGFSDTWQLVINTGTTIITFLIVFLIQNTQNRDARVVHLKLDELIKAVRGARTQLIDLRKCPTRSSRSCRRSSKPCARDTRRRAWTARASNGDDRSRKRRR